MLQSLPLGEKVSARLLGLVPCCEYPVMHSQSLCCLLQVTASDSKVCRKTTGSELKPACSASCKQSCSTGLQTYVSQYKQRMGFNVSQHDQDRMLKACARQCTYECSKQGNGQHGFAIPYRQ